MITTKTWMTAQTPSDFAVPSPAATFGTGFGMASGAMVCPVLATPTYVVRDRHEAGIAVAQAPRPGSTAWRPPIC